MAGPGRGGLLLSLLILSCLPLSVVSSDRAFAFLSSSEVNKQQKQQREFDYFVLALQWPGTICQRTRHCCSSNGCCRRSFPLTEFTIHGLWPDYNDGTWPACCTQSYFDIKKVSPLMENLEKYWPSLSCSLPSVCHGGKGLFWAHEWEKHGTCSSPVVKDEYSYFSTVLDLYFKYNITKILDDAGVLANSAKKYPLGDVIAVIEKSTGASPILVCSHGAVEELHLCFCKDFKPRDCLIGKPVLNDSLHSSGSCPKYIRLPNYRPLVTEGANSTITWLANYEDSQAITGLSAI